MIENSSEPNRLHCTQIRIGEDGDVNDLINLRNRRTGMRGADGSALQCGERASQKINLFAI